MLFFSWSRHVLVAEHEDRIVGGVVLKLFPMPGGRRGGLVSWIFTDPAVHGLGAGQRLTEAAIAFFEENGCDELVACVEGFNTSSSKLFATRGFSILSPGEQFRRWGLGTFGVWWHTFHLIDIGHFMWVRPGAERRDNPAAQWWGTVLVNSIIALLGLLRGAVQPMTFLVVPLLFILFLGLRSLAMRLAARARGLRVRYRTWESGFALNTALATLTGSLLPVLGSYYPDQEEWTYRKRLPDLGVMALAGALTVLVIALAMWGLQRYANLPEAHLTWLGPARWISANMALFDIATPFFPFVSYNGRRIWDWKRPLWFIMLVPALFVVFW
jgi:hypothetical protein